MLKYIANSFTIHNTTHIIQKTQFCMCESLNMLVVVDSIMELEETVGENWVELGLSC